MLELGTDVKEEERQSKMIADVAKETGLNWLIYRWSTLYYYIILLSSFEKIYKIYYYIALYLILLPSPTENILILFTSPAKIT